MTKLGALALMLYLPHAYWHIAHHTTWELLWACNLAMPLLIAGCFLRHGRLVTIAFLFLAFGTPLWLIDILAGGAWIPTSPLVHIGGFATAAFAIRALGWPRRTWLVASAAAAALLAFSYLVTPPSANINLVFAVYDGWEHWSPSRGVSVAALWLAATAVFWLLERLITPRITA